MKACIFDLDGTLMDSMWVWDSFAMDWLAAYHLPYTEEIRQQLSVMTLPQAAAYFQQYFSLRESAKKILEDFKQRLRQLYAQDITMKEGVESCLQQLRKQGVRLGVFDRL